jgi:hypothetical protein
MAQQLMETPSVPLNFVPAKEGEVLHLGTIVIRIMEDGSRTGTVLFSSSEYHVPDMTIRQPHRLRRVHRPTQDLRPTTTRKFL